MTTSTPDVLHDHPKQLAVAIGDLLALYGRRHILDGLPDNATEKDLMPRLVEYGVSVYAGFRLLVDISQLLSVPQHRDDLLRPVRAVAYDAQSPDRVRALQALSKIDGGARDALRMEVERAESVAAAQKAETRIGLQQCMGTR